MLECLPWSGDDAHPVDITVRFADVPDHLPDSIYADPLTELGAKGQYHLFVPNVGRYLVRDGKEILLTPICPPDQPDLRLFLETSCLAAISLQKGLLALHGSAVRISGRTIAILGSSGQGKSTMAAELARRGHGLMAEDVCVLDVRETIDQRPLLRPSLPNIRLWEDTLIHYGIAPSDLVISRRGLKKYHLVRPDWFHGAPETIDAAIVLMGARPPSVLEGLVPERGARPIGELCQTIHRPQLARKLGFQKKMVEVATRLVQEHRVFKLGTVRDMRQLSVAGDAIEKMAAGLER